MRAIGVIVNIFLPGVGTLLVGKFVEGVIQIVLVIIAILMNVSIVLAIIGVPLGIGTYIWALVSAATRKMPKMKSGSRRRFRQ